MLGHIRRKLESLCIYPLYRFLDQYFTKRIMRYYGADYGWGDQKTQNIDRKTANLGYGLFHYSLIRNLKPNRILCIGSMYGFVPYMLAKACQDNGFGHVDFVDASFDINNESDITHNFGQGFWKKVDPKKHFSFLLDSNFITTHVMTTQEFSQKYKKKYEYVYVDGDHSFAGAATDFLLFWPRLKKNGFLCFHDIHLREILGVKLEYWRVWEALKNMPFKFELPNGYSGLGIVQKLGKSNFSSLLKKAAQSRS